MKLIITIIPKTDCDAVSIALTDKKFRVTQIASTGGFLRKGNATLLIGIEDEQVESAMDIIKGSMTQSDSATKGVAFVINVDRFVHF